MNVQWPEEPRTEQPGAEQPEFVSFRMKTLIAVERTEFTEDISEVQQAAMQKIADRLVCEIRSAFMFRRAIDRLWNRRQPWIVERK